MPHSGGRVGKGIYFASEAGKSLGYSKHFIQVRTIMCITRVLLALLVLYHMNCLFSAGFNHLPSAKSNCGVMFLNEVAMGDWHIMHNDGEISWQGLSAPNKKQSTWAIGHTEPGMPISVPWYTFMPLPLESILHVSVESLECFIQESCFLCLTLSLTLLPVLPV